MATTTVLFKTDKKLKAQVQKLAKEMGVPFSAILNQCMRNIIAEGEILFAAEKKARGSSRKKQ